MDINNEMSIEKVKGRNQSARELIKELFDDKLSYSGKLIISRSLEDTPRIIEMNDNEIQSLKKEIKTTKHPIMEFKTINQAYECLKEWQERLFLTDWTIRLHLAEPDGLKDEDGKEFSGRNEFEVTIKCALISIAKLDDDKRNRIQKVCHEQTLIHELLHCKYNWISSSYTIEGKYYDTLEHSLLEQMAKSLLMAKYNLSFDWFRNFLYPNVEMATIEKTSVPDESEKRISMYKLENAVKSLKLDSMKLIDQYKTMPTKHDTCEKYYYQIIAWHKGTDRKLFHWESIINNPYDFWGWTPITPNILEDIE